MGALVSILVLGILIFVHELGHFLVAKFFRIGVLEFALGFGPKIFRFNYGETTYTLRCIPLGGFVRMVGDDPRAGSKTEEKEKAESSVDGASPIEGSLDELTPVQKLMLEDESRWFLKQPYLSKLGVVVAGPLFNLLFAWILASNLYYVRGLPVPIEDKAVIGSVIPGFPASKAGFEAHDRVVSVNGDVITSWKQLVDTVGESGGKELTFIIQRPPPNSTDLNDPAATSKTITVTGTSDTEAIDLPGGEKRIKPVFKIGILQGVTYEPTTFVTAWQIGGQKVWELAATTYKVLYGLVTLAVSPTKAIGGPIQIIKQTAETAKEGFASVVWWGVFLNVMLAVMNLLPIPVLDGGHIVMFTIEKLKGSPLSLRFQEVATQVGMGILFLLMIFAISNDLVKLFI